MDNLIDEIKYWQARTAKAEQDLKKACDIIADLIGSTGLEPGDELFDKACDLALKK